MGAARQPGVATGLAAVKGAVEEKELYLKHLHDFYTSALTDAQKFPTKAYVFGSSTDENLTNRFLETLLPGAVPPPQQARRTGPPDGLLAFYWHFIRQAKPVFAAMS